MIDGIGAVLFGIAISISLFMFPRGIHGKAFFRDMYRKCAKFGFVFKKGKHQQAVQIKNACLREMPEMIDILILGLSSGLSFDSALDLYCLRESGKLAEELSQAHLSWELGVFTREDALNQMASRVGISSLNSFATVVNEALTFGTPLAEILDRQAYILRDEQRSALETEIEKIPIKMLIPLGTLIVPAMLLAILGPLLGPALSS